MRTIEVKSGLNPVYRLVAEKLGDSMLSKDGILVYTIDPNNEDEIDVVYNEKLDKYIELDKDSYTFYLKKGKWYLVGKIGSGINDTKLIFCVSLMKYVPKDKIKRNIASRLYSSLESSITG